MRRHWQRRRKSCWELLRLGNRHKWLGCIELMNLRLKAGLLIVWLILRISYLTLIIELHRLELCSLTDSLHWNLVSPIASVLIYLWAIAFIINFFYLLTLILFLISLEIEIFFGFFSIFLRFLNRIRVRFFPYLMRLVQFKRVIHLFCCVKCWGNLFLLLSLGIF